MVAPDCETVQPRFRAGRPRRLAVRRQDRAKLTLVGRPRLATALRRGLSVRVTGAPVGKVTLTARSGKTVVARGSATVKAGGAATVRLKFTAKGRAKLRRSRRATLTISGAGAPLKVTVRR